MPCFYPRYAKRSEKPNENGKYPINFSWKGSQLENDFIIPCGKCLGCRKRQKMDWAIRCIHESYQHERNCMVTLTYDNEHLPLDGKLDASHIKTFIKKCRKAKLNIRYFAAGEYGEKKGRAHYHVIIFGEDFRGLCRTVRKQLYTNPTLEKLWAHGEALAIDLTPASCMYTAGYILKKAGDDETFSSKSINIGKQWAMENRRHIENQPHCTVNGKPYPWPQVYKKWLVEAEFHSANQRPEEIKPEYLRNREINLKGATNAHATGKL